MERQAQPVNRDDWLEEHFWGPLWVFGIMLVLVFLVGLAIFSIGKGDHNSHVNHDKNLAKLFYSSGAQANDQSQATRAKRQHIAQEIIDVVARYKVANEEPLRISAMRMKQIRQIAQDGRPFTFTMRDWKMADFWDFIDNWLTLLVVDAIFGIFFLIHFYFGVDPAYRLADLPWRNRLWPWLVTILGGPVVWTFMVTSLLYLRHDKKDWQVPAPGV